MVQAGTVPATLHRHLVSTAKSDEAGVSLMKLAGKACPQLPNGPGGSVTKFWLSVVLTGRGALVAGLRHLQSLRTGGVANGIFSGR